MKKLGTKAIIAAMVSIIAVVAIILVILMRMTTSYSNELLRNQSKMANDAFAQTLDNYQAEALERAEMIAANTDVIAAVASGNSMYVKSALEKLSTGFDLITLCDAEGNVLARTHSSKTGDSVLSQKAISTALSTGKGISTIEKGTEIGLSTRGSAAIKDSKGNIIGAVTCGHDLSQTKYIDSIKSHFGCQATFFAGDVRMSTTLVDEKGDRVIGTRAREDIAKTVLEDKKDYNGRTELFGTTYAVYYSPVIVNDQAVGMLFTGVDIEDILKQERNMSLMIIIAAVMLVLTLLITTFIVQSTSKRAFWYESMLDSIPFPISVTDMDMKWTFINKPVEQMLNLKRADVLGNHCSNWGAGICNTDNCGINCLRNNKEVTFFDQGGAHCQVNIAYLHNARGKKEGHIEIVQDITKMVDSQKAQTELVNRIREVSGAFVEASRQIADGAQSLAQGSTQQAAAVEQLSSSISEVSNKTKDNAILAGKAANLANTIRSNAEKGSRQMDEMMTAVREINDASQGISKVISVIDNIAFQTNILALNAAVEAARAGQHGKGFAVVAEEVRSLASKSADAARETGGMIENSMKKAELGSRIAGETAVSLVDIVMGIKESSQLVSDIARSSEEQALGIEQINKGIDQVAQVVQQNSATAEQSAAASEELSGQSSVLQELLNDFDSDQEGDRKLTSGGTRSNTPSPSGYGKY